MKVDEEEEVEIDQRRLPADYDTSNFDPTERVWKLVDEISGLTLVEAAELSCIMMRKLGMREMPVIGVMKASAGGGVALKTSTASKEEKKPEKTAFELKMDSYEAASKLKVIKEIRSFTDLGLKEAKDLVEKTPAVLKKGVSKEEAEKIIEKMKAVGANVVMELVEHYLLPFSMWFLYSSRSILRFHTTSSLALVFTIYYPDNEHTKL